ncbi:hypothetical protein C8R43DRAFT_1131921 [Mycena crocata]|nr:hypothetical protein C8R43DRAFT_1131921 [Mycena crocata]
MNRSEGVDHLNIVSWTGHAIAGDCHAPSAWEEGCRIAQEIFAKLHFPPESYNYAVIFKDLEIDMLRPWGEDKYPGVETDIDRSLIVPKGKTATTVSSSAPADTPSSNPSTSEPVAPSSSSSPASIHARCAPSTSNSPSPPPLTSDLDLPSPPSIETTAAPNDDDDIEDQGDGIPFEDTLDEVPELALHLVVGLTRTTISLSKSTERLKRVRGHTKVNSKKRDDVNPAAILGANTFIVGDPFFTILRTDQTLSLAIVRSTAIHEDGISRGSILAPTIRNSAAKVKLSGQVLSMTMIPTLDDNLPESESAIALPRPLSHEQSQPGRTSEEQSPWSWIWNGRFLKVDSLISGTKQTTEKVAIVSIPGVLTELVNPRPVDAVPRLGDRAYEINSEGRSWELDDGPMGAVCELLWDVVVAEKIPLTSIASVKKSSEFPYAFDNGKPALVCQDGTQQLIQQHDNKVQRVCHLCGERPGNWRAHISTHILRCIRRVTQVLCVPIGASLPCGFCASSGRPECEVHLCKKGPTTHVQSNCPMVSAFNYKSAEQGSKSTPCRNVPVVCRLCFPDAPRPGATQRAQWRYNMPEHLSIAHPEYSSPLSPGGTRLPYEVWESIKVEAAEEHALGIPEGSIPTVFEDVAGPDEGLDRSNIVGKKRGKAQKARFCQSGSATEIVELLEGLKARLELLGVPLPEMVTVDNCCTVGNKIRDVLPLIKVLLDVYHFIIYAAGILGGVHNPQRTAVLKDIKEAILKVPSSKGVLAQYWSQGEQETRLTAAYDKWLQRGVWSAAAQNIHAAQMQHVRKGCLARPREDIASDGSRIEGSHKGWNDLQRANASGLVTMTVLGHDHVLRRNIRVALNGKSAAPTPFITSTFGSHHISLVDHTASIWNDLLTSSHNSSSQLVPLPRLPDINSGEKFGLVNSVHTESFGGLFTIKEEPEDDANVVKELDLDEQEDLMRELNLNAAQFIQPMLAPLQPPSTSTLNVGTSDFGSVNADNEIRTGVISTAPDLLVIPAEASLSSGSTQGIKRKSISASTDLSTSCADAPSEPKKVRLDSERPMHPLFGRSTSSLTSSQSPTAVPDAAPKIKSLGELTAPLPEPESSAGLPTLTRSQLFFTMSTGTDPRSLQIHRGKEFFLFMTMRREFQWKSYEMKSRNWVEATREYNTRLRQLPDGGQLISKNPRALLDQLGDIEQKIATRIINNDFTSSTSTSTDNAVKPLRKPQTCTRCKTIKYPGPSGSPENHKKSFCSDGFRPTLKGETVPAWPLPPGIFTNGTDFHPLVFLAGVRELYEALVIQRVNREDFSMEDEAFYQLLSARVTLDKATGAVMFKLYSELNVPDSDGVPVDMYIEYMGSRHLYINSLRDTGLFVAQE